MAEPNDANPSLRPKMWRQITDGKSKKDSEWVVETVVMYRLSKYDLIHYLRCLFPHVPAAELNPRVCQRAVSATISG